MVFGLTIFLLAQQKQKLAGNDVAAVNPGGEFTPAQRFFLSWAQVRIRFLPPFRGEVGNWVARNTSADDRSK